MEIEPQSPGHGATAQDPTGNGWYCGGRRKQPNPEWPWCTNRAGLGTDHVGVGCCKLHGGSTRTHQRAAAVAMAEKACEQLGIPIEVDGVTALTNRLWEAEGDLWFYREQVAALGIDITEFEEGGGEFAATRRVPHVLVTLYHQAEERSAKIAAECIKAGLEQRRLELDQARAAEVFRCVAEALKAMGLGERLEEFRHAFAAAIRGRVLLGTG
jgi:hypothetical protein